MNSDDSPKNWLQKEKWVFYAVFWLPPGLLLYLLAGGVLFPFGVWLPMTYMVPYAMYFTSAVCFCWGAVLVGFGVRQRGGVLALIGATVASSIPLWFLLFFLVQYLLGKG